MQQTQYALKLLDTLGNTHPSLTQIHLAEDLIERHLEHYILELRQSMDSPPTHCATRIMQRMLGVLTTSMTADPVTRTTSSGLSHPSHHVSPSTDVDNNNNTLSQTPSDDGGDFFSSSYKAESESR